MNKVKIKRGSKYLWGNKQMLEEHRRRQNRKRYVEELEIAKTARLNNWKSVPGNKQSALVVSVPIKKR